MKTLLFGIAVLVVFIVTADAVFMPGLVEFVVTGIKAAFSAVL